MAIQYYMRAYNTTLSKYVDWVVNDSPDSTGTFSGYPTNQLINITVNRIVQSRVSNFLKKNQSLGGTDGYYFHVNSYDWRNATAPISPPTSLTGFAVERGINAVAAVSSATNTSPITIVTAAPHGLVSGQIVTIIGVTGNTNANGTWPLEVTSPTSFILVGSVGNGAFISGGNAFLPNDMSTLMWDEPNQTWRFAYNTNGDGTTIGAAQDVSLNSLAVVGNISIGPDPADSGVIRLSNNTFINWESNPTGTDIQGIGVDNFNRIKLGSLTTDQVYVPGAVVVDGYVQHDGLGNDTPNIGFIRDKNNTVIVAFRRQDLGADIAALSSTSANRVVLGDAVNSGIIYNTSTGSIHQFQVNSVPDVEIGNTFVRFTETVTAPTIFQTTTSTTNQTGQRLTLQAQNGGPGTSAGGPLSLTSGVGQGTGGHGTVDINIGNEAQPKVIHFPTINAGANNNSILYSANLFRVDNTQLVPRIRQDDTAATPGATFTLQAQNSTNGSGVGGILNLTSGSGPTTSGRVNVQTGGTTQIIVSPTTIPPGLQTPTTGSVIVLGNFEVAGTTTTVDSTVVDIIGRVIHANWADPLVSPNVAPPTLDAGYSIHRGNTLGIPRDGAAWIWTENPDGYSFSGFDGYWRSVTIPGDGLGSDNFNISNSLNTVGVLSKDFVSSTDPNPISGYVASAGNLRTPNNTSAVVARSILPSTTLTAAGLTNGSASLPLATITVVSTTNFTTSGTLLIQSSAGTQTVTYTGTTGTSFTGVVGGTGTIVTGGIVAQTNNTTTFNGANGTSLPTATINVVSTTGFPASGNLRVVAQTTNAANAAVSVQNIAYTGTTGTSFTGCTGGTGFLFSGDTVTTRPIPGISDLILLGTDFGNRILHGDPTNNTGHIFNTPSGFFYDFQVNNVTQVRLAQGDIDASGFTDTIAIGPTVFNPQLIQTVLPNTGASNGNHLMIKAQNGQQQTGVTTNNNGGSLLLNSGTAGTGGSGAAGIDGYVDIYTGNTLKIRVFPTDASPVGSSGDDNSILYFESLFRVDAAQTGAGPLAGTGVRFRQDDTGAATGAVYTVQAQSAATTGGNLVLTSGAGSSAANAGQVKLSTGLTAGLTPTIIDRVVVYPTGSPVLPQGPSNTTYTEFRDTAQAVFINPVSAGIASLGFASTVLGAQIAQVATTTTNGAPMTIQSQVTSFNGATGGNLVLISGNATGTTSTGGNINLTTGTGTNTFGNGVVNVMIGGTQAIQFNNVDNDASGFSEVMTIASTIGTPRIFQASTGSASGTILALMAQNAVTTGGPLQLHSGTGATNDGYINLTTGNTVKMTIFPTTAVSAADNNSILVFENKFRFDTAQLTPLIRQDDRTTAAGTGETFTIQAQNETGTTSTGGLLVLTSGTGTTTAGNVSIQTGGVDKIIVHPAFTEFRDTAEALRITPVSAGTTQITYASTVLAAQINQTSTGSATGADMTVRAQSAATNGGRLFLSGGQGSTTANDGYVALETGGIDRVIVRPTFTEIRDFAEALRFTPVSTGTTSMQFASTVLASRIFQADLTTASGTGATLTVQAQNETGTTSFGGDLSLTSGTGTFADGYTNLQAGGSTVARVHTNKFIFSKGSRRHITQISSGATYVVLASDDYIAITTLSAPFQINLPTDPVLGDTYEFKDATGNAGTQTVTISGNAAFNIDGTTSIVLNQAYASVTVTFTGSEWSVT